MALATRNRTRAVLVVLALTLLGAAVDATLWWRAARWNAAIASGRLPAASDGLPAEVRFAQAAAQAASGAEEEALRTYRALQSPSAIGQAARYNSANLLMQQAARVSATDQPGQAIPLIELAKESYREVLRNDPAQWDARYNLERAQRLLPDPEEGEVTPAEGSRNAERAATTMRGYSPGLP